jgi:hypothetical protein
MLYGASKEDTREPSFANLVIQQVLQKHPECAEAIFEAILAQALPSELCKLAAICREIGDLAVAYSIETIADQRERGGSLELHFLRRD